MLLVIPFQYCFMALQIQDDQISINYWNKFQDQSPVKIQQVYQQAHSASSVTIQLHCKFTEHQNISNSNHSVSRYSQVNQIFLGQSTMYQDIPRSIHNVSRYSQVNPQCIKIFPGQPTGYQDIPRSTHSVSRYSQVNPQ